MQRDSQWEATSKCSAADLCLDGVPPVLLGSFRSAVSGHRPVPAYGWLHHLASGPCLILEDPKPLKLKLFLRATEIVLA